MSNFIYKNPISSKQLIGTQSVGRTNVFGTNFSVLGVGGFMEVYNIDDLYFTIPSGTTGVVELSGNTIPINLLIVSGGSFSQNVLTLNSDNISSGRRKLGMLVYVKEMDQIYQYNIDNYEMLWTAATAATNTVVITDFGTIVKSNTAAGVNFISAWTANTVDGVSGVTRANAVWKKYYGNNLSVTGGSYNSGTGTLTLTNITGGTQSIAGFSTVGGGSIITGGTFIYSAQTLELYSSGGTISITGFSDVFVTGGTYSAGTITFTNNSGSTFDVTGLTTGNMSGDYLPLSGGTVTGDTIFQSGLTANTISASTYLNLPLDVYVTGGTYSAGTITFINNSGTTFDVTGLTTGTSVVQGITGITGTSGVSATTTDYGTIIINTSPDQTVTITGGTNIEIAGAYPNFGVNYTGATSLTFNQVQRIAFLRI